MSSITDPKFNSTKEEASYLLEKAGYEWYQAPNGERVLLPIDTDIKAKRELFEREAELFSQLPEALKAKLSTFPNSYTLPPLPNEIQPLSKLKKIDPNTL